MPLVERSDVKIYFEKQGQGPRVVFVQGAGVIGNGWRPQIDQLAHHFETVIIDNRGIGRSTPFQGMVRIEDMSADVVAVMDEIGWDHAHLVGHSIGGLIIQQLALDHPERVQSLSLLCTFGRGKDGAKLSLKMFWLFLRTRIGSARMRRHAFLSMIFSKKYRAGNDLDRLAEEAAPLMGHDLADQDPIAMKQVRAMARHDVSARLPELKNIPALIISTEEDPIARPEYAKVIADALPSATFEVLKEASHAVTIEKPALINAKLLAFITATEMAAQR